MSKVTDLALNTLAVEQHGRVVTAHYASPPLNFATIAFIRDLDTLTAAVDRDASVGAVVLTGGVEGRFLTHADPAEIGGISAIAVPPPPQVVLRALWRATRTALRIPGALRLLESAGGPTTQAVAWGYRWRRTILRMNRSAAVYIAAINGPTTGGGHEIALACDLRFVSDAPNIRLGQIETGRADPRRRRYPAAAETDRHRQSPRAHARGAPLTAGQALGVGLVNAIVPDADLVTHAQDTGARLARRAPVAIRAIKRLTYFTNSRPLPTGLDNELAAFLTAGLQPAMKTVQQAFASDLATLQDSPLSSGAPQWVAGTRVNQTGDTQ
ncbi:Short-chain-enoyl-CoA hydratase [Mycobacterium talmoniae]|uniref:Short-chain-enoyl-CoA hydratase n=1 Tax=Mycobacterium talmoniae TaxID=1858794 RepID=A0A2S8BNQ2_9MYCO|nr:Short-chain-enoyl-CoA hydratase [Mycobacterium talmoniae]